MNKNEQIVKNTLDEALKSGRTPIIVAFIGRYPLSSYWQDKISDRKNTFVWKLDNTYVHGESWIMGLWLNAPVPIIPIIAVTPDVHKQIVKEIYKYEDNNS